MVTKLTLVYCTRAIITRSLYIYLPIFESQKVYLRSFFRKNTKLGRFFANATPKLTTELYSMNIIIKYRNQDMLFLKV